MAEQKHEKDIHRYSVSRFTTFKECPRKHYYQYVEQIPEPYNEYTESGSYFHRCVEAILKGEDVEPIYAEFRKDVDNGLIKLDRDQLEYTVSHYFSYYYNDYKNENLIYVEETFEEPLEGEDYMVEKLDQAYEIHGMLAVRDIKSTRSELKYTTDIVRKNNQLLTYVSVVEENLNRMVDFIEIDEVRMAKLATEVPTISGNKLSTSMDALSLVTADLFREELERRGQLDDPKYKAVLDKLTARGHPLFRRVKYQIINRNIIEANNDDNYDIYTAASMGIKYRNKPTVYDNSSRCFMCPYKNLCWHDENGGDSMLREEIIKNLSR